MIGKSIFLFGCCLLSCAFGADIDPNNVQNGTVAVNATKPEPEPKAPATETRSGTRSVGDWGQQRTHDGDSPPPEIGWNRPRPTQNINNNFGEERLFEPAQTDFELAIGRRLERMEDVIERMYSLMRRTLRQTQACAGGTGGSAAGNSQGDVGDAWSPPVSGGGWVESTTPPPQWGQSQPDWSQGSQGFSQGGQSQGFSQGTQSQGQGQSQTPSQSAWGNPFGGGAQTQGNRRQAPQPQMSRPNFNNQRPTQRRPVQHRQARAFFPIIE